MFRARTEDDFEATISLRGVEGGCSAGADNGGEECICGGFDAIVAVGCTRVAFGRDRPRREVVHRTPHRTKFSTWFHFYLSVLGIAVATCTHLVVTTRHKARWDSLLWPRSPGVHLERILRGMAVTGRKFTLQRNVRWGRRSLFPLAY